MATPHSVKLLSRLLRALWSPVSDPAILRPGSTVPKSGVYIAIHDGGHGEGDVTCLSGDRFPACNRCGDRVRFKAKSVARYISRHYDFR